jgi:hypothetical protein
MFKGGEERKKKKGKEKDIQTSRTLFIFLEGGKKIEKKEESIASGLLS